LEKAIFVFIIIVVVLSSVLAIVQSRKNRKVRKGIKLIIRWFDYIVRHPGDFEIETVRRLGDDVDAYFAATNIGINLMYFAPKLQDYIIERFGKNEGETTDDAFKRLAFWEADKVKLEVYWTMIRGNFAEYAAMKSQGKNLDFGNVSAPVCIIRRYWRV